jgi:hypothetical protein
MLADALVESGNARPTYIKFQNVVESKYNTRQLLEMGFPAEETLLGNTMRNTANSLGGEVKHMSSYVDLRTRHVNMEAIIDYR